ncbi:MAG: N-acetyltransferase GCN5 [Bacillota bacterium]|nr:MAG: N-acetyltransferase GCN5 [Bacillota bacterium]
MREALLAIWQVCFEEQPAPVRYFFETYFEPHNCLVYEVNDEAVAMVHLLPAQIVHNNSLIQAHYIYAAATLPEHRSKGYMSTLLNHAAEVGAKRGDEYSFLLPSQSDLYRYYGRLGYVPYFQTRFVTLSNGELRALAAGGRKSDLVLNCQQVKSLRNSHIVACDGSVLWGEKAISYAVGISKLYGGQLICSQAGEQFGYALCSATHKENCTVVEIVADEDASADLLATILLQVPAQTYRFRLPGFSSLFAQQGEVSTQGMIKPLLHNDGLSTTKSGLPYLGLTLD